MTETSSKTGGMLFLHALTAVHPGSGTGLGVVDLPVMRERHTSWPLVPGSTLKGVLRDAFRERHAVDGDRKKANEEDGIIALFGPASVTKDSQAFAGALSISDARVLAFPVRSVKGVFAWVTCPEVLQRFRRDGTLVGLADLPAIPELKENEAACADKDTLCVDGKTLVLEEFDFTCTSEVPTLAKDLAEHIFPDDVLRESFQKRLVVLNNDDFTYFTRHAVEIVARIGLDYDTKTVKDKALFYEEFLPPETVFYALVLSTRSRGGTSMKALEVREKLGELLAAGQVLQIGADETIGKGLCNVRLFTNTEGRP